MRGCGLMQGVRDTFEHFWLTLRASAIGLGIGASRAWAVRSRSSLPTARAAHVEASRDLRQGPTSKACWRRAREQFAGGRKSIPTVAFRDPGSVSIGDLLSVSCSRARSRAGMLTPTGRHLRDGVGDCPPNIIAVACRSCFSTSSYG